MSTHAQWLNAVFGSSYVPVPPVQTCLYCANEPHPASDNQQCLACEVQGARDEYDRRVRESWPISEIFEAHAEMQKWERIERRER